MDHTLNVEDKPDVNQHSASTDDQPSGNANDENDENDNDENEENDNDENDENETNNNNENDENDNETNNNNENVNDDDETKDNNDTKSNNENINDANLDSADIDNTHNTEITINQNNKNCENGINWTEIKPDPFATGLVPQMIQYLHGKEMGIVHQFAYFFGIYHIHWCMFLIELIASKVNIAHNFSLNAINCNLILRFEFCDA